MICYLILIWGCAFSSSESKLVLKPAPLYIAPESDEERRRYRQHIVLCTKYECAVDVSGAAICNFRSVRSVTTSLEAPDTLVDNIRVYDLIVGI